MLITTPAEVDAVARELRAAGSFALDLEFVPEDRFAPELALVQVGWGDPASPRVVAIDPLAVDPRPVLALVGDEDVAAIVHSAQGDLAVVAGMGIAGARVCDTQIAAAFLGHGDQIGYAPLVARLLGVRLEKQAQFTEWLQRPLTEAQIAYALDDVRYLPALWETLRADLDRRGRLPWVTEECDRLAGAVRAPEPAEAYRRVRGGASLSRRAQGALRALAEWRMREAQRLNHPLSHVLADRSLIALARSLPRDDQGLLAVRGIGEGAVRRYGGELLHAIREGSEHPPAVDGRGAPLDRRAEVWAAVLQGLVRSSAAAADVAPRFVATRGELELLAEWWLHGDRASAPAIPLLEGWRRALAGDAALRWLAGEALLAADPAAESGLRLEADRPRPAAC